MGKYYISACEILKCLYSPIDLHIFLGEKVFLSKFKIKLVYLILEINISCVISHTLCSVANIKAQYFIIWP